MVAQMPTTHLFLYLQLVVGHTVPSNACIFIARATSALASV